MVEDSVKSRYLLKDYVFGEKKIIKIEEAEYEIQLFEGDHSGEYVVSEMRDGKVDGRCQLFDHGVLSLAWIMKDGKRVGGVTEFEDGKVLHRRNWSSIVSGEERRLVENLRDGLFLSITTKSEVDGSDIEIYRGDFDVDMNRNGYGLEYDRKSGKEKIEGFWENDKLVRVIREFDTTKGKMIEYVENDNVEIWSRVPVYIGGYCLKDGSFVRNGVGCLIDELSGAAVRQSEWKQGIEKNGVDLYEGWFAKGMKESIRSVLSNKKPEDMSCKPEVNTSIPKENDVSGFEKLNAVTPEKLYALTPEMLYALTPEMLYALTPEKLNAVTPEKLNDVTPEKLNAVTPEKLNAVTPEKLNAVTPEKQGITTSEKNVESPANEDLPDQDLEIQNMIVTSNSYNTMSNLDFNKYHNLSSIEIGDNCFASITTFKIDGLSQLKRLKIGWNSFNKTNNRDERDESKSFYILNCESLESIDIGELSFSDFGGQFELKNLPALQSIKIGQVGSASYNFSFSSCVIHGNKYEK